MTQSRENDRWDASFAFHAANHALVGRDCRQKQRHADEKQHRERTIDCVHENVSWEKRPRRAGAAPRRRRRRCRQRRPIGVTHWQLVSQPASADSQGAKYSHHHDGRQT